MASPAKSHSNNTPEVEGHEGANVDKIRDILFGSQMRDYDKRFGRLEDRLIKDAESLRDEMKKRFETLEAFVQKELESLGVRLKTEKAERAEAVKELGVQHRDAAKAFDKRLGSLDDQLTGDTAELRGYYTRVQANVAGETPVATAPHTADVMYTGQYVMDLRRTPEG